MIIPAFTAPYVATVILPWLLLSVLFVEVLVLYLRERQVGLGNATLWVVLANVASWIVGVAITGVLFPSGLAADGNPAPSFETLTRIAIPVALVLSIVIEAFVLAKLARTLITRSPWVTMAIANVCSYAIATAVFFWSR